MLRMLQQTSSEVTFITITNKKITEKERKKEKKQKKQVLVTSLKKS